MLQMLMKSGDNERILNLVEVPEFVLVQFCDAILRKQDLRDPDARYMLRETINAIKVKAEEEPSERVAFDRASLKAQVTQIESLLAQFDQE